MKKLVLALVLLVLGGLALWLALGGSGREVEPATVAPRPSSAAPAPAGDPDAVPLSAPDVSEPGAGPGRERRASEGSQESAGSSELATSLLVVRVDDGRAVPRAEVAFLDTAELLPEELEDLGEFELAAGVLRRRTDERGRASVPRPRGEAWASATAPGLYGRSALGAAQASGRIELRPDSEIRVHVARRDGTPAAGVPVVLRQAASAEGLTVARAVTDERGDAALRHPIFLLSTLDGAGPFAVAVDLPFLPRVERPWEPLGRADARVDLALPPSGSLEVRIVAPAGAPLREPCLVFLLASSPSASGTVEARQRTSDGTARFPLVGLGLELDATALPFEGSEAGITSGPGPAAEGALAVLEIRAVGAFTLLTGRLLGPGGAPLAETRFDFVLASGASGAKRTDAAGRFEIGAQEESDALELRASVGGASLGASLPLGRLARGVRDLGDVRLELGPLLAGGRVVDESGRAIAGARVRCDTAEGGLDALSDLEGRFVFRGFADTDSLTLTAQHGDFGLASVEVARGSADATLVLPGVGRLAGRVLVDPGVPLAALVVFARAQSHEESDSVPLRFDGSFELARLAPGAYEVVAGLAEEFDCSQTIAGVAVRAGETARDPRLDPLDLRGRFHSFTIRTVDENGAPLAVAGASLRRRGPELEAYGEEALALDTGEVRVTTCQPFLRLLLSAPGRRTLELGPLAEDRTVPWRAGLALALELLDPPVLPAGDRLVVLVHRELGLDAAFEGRAPLDATGRCELPLHESGWMKVFLELERNGLGTSPVSTEAEARFEVLDQDGLQPFSFALSPASRARIAALLGGG